MIDMGNVRRMLNNNSAEDFVNDVDAIRLFSKPPVLNSSLIDGNKVLIGIRGAGKSMLLRCYYNFFLTLTLCELTRKQKVSYFPVLIKPKIINTATPEEIYHILLEEMKLGISNTIERITDSHGKATWLEDVFNIPLKCMLKVPEFKKYAEEYFDEENVQFKYHDEFVYQKEVDGGYIKGFLNDFTFLLPKIADVKTPEELNEKCFRNFVEHNIIEKFIFLIDDISSLNDDFYLSKGLFDGLLEGFRKCGCFQFIISVIQNSLAEVITNKKRDFFAAERIVYNLNSIEEIRNAREYIKELLKCFLNINDIHELIEIDDLPFYNDQITDSKGDALEQLVYASRALPRWIFTILRSAIEKFRDYNGMEDIEPLCKDEIISIIKDYAVAKLSPMQVYKRYVTSLINVCSQHNTFKFSNENNNNAILKSLVFNDEGDSCLLCEDENYKNTQSKYAFNYAYCVLTDLPTHFNNIQNSIDNTRSILNGQWIDKSFKVNFNKRSDNFNFVGVND